MLPHLTHCENQYRVHLMHEFMPPKPFLVFQTEHAQSTILGLRLMFWVVPSHFVAALDTFAKTGIEVHLMHEFMPLEPFLGFLQQTCPINYFRSKTYVLDGFAPFCCCTEPVAKISIRVHLKHEFVPPKPFLVWSQLTYSIHNFRSKTHVDNSA